MLAYKVTGVFEDIETNFKTDTSICWPTKLQAYLKTSRPILRPIPA